MAQVARRARGLGTRPVLLSHPSQGPIERFSSFIHAAAQERPALLAPPESLANPDVGRDDAVLAIGSLFNFACAPEDLPVIRPRLYDLLEQTLGYDWTYRISLVEQYKRHLAFAEDVKTRLQAAGIQQRDMLDAQSLIQDAGVHADFWTAADEEEGPRARQPSKKPYLSICAIYRDEGPYLREWIEFHRLAGVERFFLYDNLSEDDHVEVLAPYVEDGTVTVRRWPVFDPQTPAYNDCLRWHRHDSRWIAFIDVDEFLFSLDRAAPAGGARRLSGLPGRGRRVGDADGGDRTRPPGLVIENYLRRVEQPDPVMNLKSVVDPTRAMRFLSGHHCTYSHMLRGRREAISGRRTHPCILAVLREVAIEPLPLQVRGGIRRQVRALASDRQACPSHERTSSGSGKEADDGVTDETILGSRRRCARRWGARTFVGESGYDREFFERYQRSALRQGAVPGAARGGGGPPGGRNLLRPRSVVDVGCGTGTWLKAFEEHGVSDFFGVDGEAREPDGAQIPRIVSSLADLRSGVNLDRRFDLAVSLEVAEHLPEESALDFVQSLTRLASVVMFSAAIPHQGGIEHVNVQWPEYWQELFGQSNFVAVDCVRPKIWANPNHDVVRAEHSLFVEQAHLESQPELRSEYECSRDRPLSIVHPTLFHRGLRPWSHLEKLKQSKEKGILTDEEFQAKKAEILARL